MAGFGPELVIALSSHLLVLHHRVSLVLARHQGSPWQLLLRKQGAMPADDFGNRRLLHPEPMVSAASAGPRPHALMIEPMDLANMRAIVAAP